MTTKNLSLILVLIMTSLMAYATATRSYELNNMNKPGYNLEARLQASGSSKATECLKAIEDLNSCSNVIAMFFAIGRTDIAHCCSAIDNVTSKCSSWPNLNMYTLPSFGYTFQESDVLKNYCSEASSPAASPAVSPAFSPASS